MFDVGSTELLLIIIVAVVVIGPKDLPRALYRVGQVMGKARAMSRHFRSGIDAMIREAEMEDLQKKWASENRRIMEQYPATDVVEEPVALVAPAEASQNTGAAPHNPESSPAPEKPA
ncbi:MAG: twin-arginine translocase subunit TatB [Sphingobium sp.]|nr:twin-arginine translocase subunit TatB [Sphingobium sp.]MBP6112156.1 twin-arginine translocase subunit TatB [Sphingobium sp.]MBP8670372.1 twin-arginine translocase subunit TatB [Sphingobium sp.]MBP9157666.1 twin-arginine translocase subunit TatB [Sphingobium sp.]MCC6482647.1 twin-arginine translocase subunit TatB [Sphingomonadaceae bacterium]